MLNYWSSSSSSSSDDSWDAFSSFSCHTKAKISKVFSSKYQNNKKEKKIEKKDPFKTQLLVYNKRCLRFLSQRAMFLFGFIYSQVTTWGGGGGGGCGMKSSQGKGEPFVAKSDS